MTRHQRPYVRAVFQKLAAQHAANAEIICDFIDAEITEQNIKETTKEGMIKCLIWLSAHFEHKKQFNDMTKPDILGYLNSLRKPPTIDPSNRSIGTYNHRTRIYSKFFRWLYSPDEPDWRKRVTPPCMSGIRQLPRKEKSRFKPSDLWTEEEDGIFLKYCPSKRDRCYFAMALDTSARPSELLRLRIKDLVFKLAGDGATPYAEIQLSGKTGQRTVPLIHSIPYVKDWISNGHPLGSNPDAWLFVSGYTAQGRKSGYEGKLEYERMYHQFAAHYRKEIFPRLLNQPVVPATDKAGISTLLKKPWTLYTFRHTGLTRKAKLLKEHMLRQYAGWSMDSTMPQVYLHFFGNESSNSLLEAYGIVTPESKALDRRPKAVACPNCSELNTPEAKFCQKCNFIMTYEGYTKVADEKHEEKKRLRDEIKQDVLKELAQILKKVKPEILKEGLSDL